MVSEPALGLYELGHTRHPSTVFHRNGTAMCTTDPVLSAVFCRLVMEGLGS